MIESNIFRPLPRLKTTQAEDDDIDGVDMKSEQDPQWPYLLDIYELFLRLVQMRGVNQAVLQHHISDSFIYRFLDLFNSQMTLEREYLLQILRKLYSRMIQKRKVIRKAMNQYLFELIAGVEER